MIINLNKLDGYYYIPDLNMVKKRKRKKEDKVKADLKADVDIDKNTIQESESDKIESDKVESDKIKIDKSDLSELELDKIDIDKEDVDKEDVSKEGKHDKNLSYTINKLLYYVKRNKIENSQDLKRFIYTHNISEEKMYNFKVNFKLYGEMNIYNCLFLFLNGKIKKEEIIKYIKGEI